jgi:hypothetical protein
MSRVNVDKSLGRICERESKGTALRVLSPDKRSYTRQAETVLAILGRFCLFWPPE